MTSAPLAIPDYPRWKTGDTDDLRGAWATIYQQKTYYLGLYWARANRYELRLRQGIGPPLASWGPFTTFKDVWHMRRVVARDLESVLMESLL